MISIIKGTNGKPAITGILLEFLTANSDILDGVLLTGYPIIGAVDESYSVDVVWVSPTRGVWVFDMIEGEVLDSFHEKQDDIYNKLEAKLKTTKSLTRGRSLKFKLNILSFASYISADIISSSQDYLIVTKDSLISVIDSRREGLDSELCDLISSQLQNMNQVRLGRSRLGDYVEGTKGYKLKQLEASIATLDPKQGEAVLQTVKGIQRIRGLAGSGKTIILAFKAAYLHLKNPDWRIAVTFNTRSLKPQFKRLITNFYVSQVGVEPDWGKLHILNAWGAEGSGVRNGLYYNYCNANSLEYYNFNSAKAKFGASRAFEKICEEAINAKNDVEPIYDVILVDEAQDFSSAFLMLCYKALSQDKMLVYAYDELQSLTKASLPAPGEIFFDKNLGRSLVNFEALKEKEPSADIVLHKCYRNSKSVLAAAHALGFGVYKEQLPESDTNLIQIFDDSHLWFDVGYKNRLSETIHDGDEVQLYRTEDSSPQFLESHSHIDDIIQFHCFEDTASQSQWLVDSIVNDLNSEQLSYNDIIVVNTNPVTTNSVSAPVRALLAEKGIRSHVAGVSVDPDTFFDQLDSITFTGIYRAKGNEAGIVYIINAQDCNDSEGDVPIMRNRLFTAMTRSKAWVRVLGYGMQMEKLKQEFELVKSNNFELHFIYPTEVERKDMRILHSESKNKTKTIMNGDLTINDLIKVMERDPDNIPEKWKSDVERLTGLLHQKVSND